MIINPREYKGIVLDTNLLLLFVVGSYNPELISKFDRVKSYKIDDFENILIITSKFKTIFTSPNILTELTNLIDNFSKEHDLMNLVAAYLVVP